MVNAIFAKNWLGMPCSDDDLRQIPMPKFETALHVSLKGMQAGAIAGYFGSRLGMSVQKFVLKRPSMENVTAQQFLEKSCKTSRNFMFAGLALSIPMFIAHGMSKGVDEEGYYDRAYRIRYNAAQLNVDRTSLGLGVVYGGLFVMKQRSFLLGFPKGVCWGTILAPALNNFNKAQEIKETMNAD